METITSISETFVGFVWGYGASFTGGFSLLVIMLLLAGLFFTLYYRIPQIRHIKHAIMITAGKYDKPEDKGEITHFQALCAALSATIGLGNIAGVAVAIVAGGPGAVFWMWLAAALGAATKFSSISLSMFYRDVDEDGMTHGGPMYTIKNALGKSFAPLAFMYALFTILSSFGAGNMFQSQSVASLAHQQWNIPTWLTGVIFAVLAAMVIIGGIKRIGNVASKLVPFMVVLYFGSAVVIVLMNITMVPELIGQIIDSAFNGTAAVGGFAGVAFKEALAQGIRRAVFSNEAGMGTAAMAHSAAKSSPIQEGIVGLLGPYIDTVIVCTVTALVLLITGAWHTTTGLEGAPLTSYAFSQQFGPIGGWIVTITVLSFAFSTIISWSYYGEKGTVFIFGRKGIWAYRWIFVAFTFIGAILELKPVINFSDAVFGLLAIPNLIANVLLSRRLGDELKDYEAKLAKGEV